MALDDATRDFLAQAAAAGGPPLHEMTVEQAREMNAGLTPLYGTGPELASVQDVTLEANGSSFPEIGRASCRERVETAVGAVHGKRRGEGRKAANITTAAMRPWHRRR